MALRLGEEMARWLTRPTRPRQRRSLAWMSLALILVWLGFSTSGSLWLIWLTYENRLEGDLRQSAAQVARAIVATRMSPPASSLVELFNRQAPAQQLAQELQRDPRLTFIMFWDASGYVVSHSQNDQVGTFLDPNLWPPMEPAEQCRRRRRHLPGTEVWEWTLSMASLWPEGPEGFITLGFKARSIDAAYWELTRQAYLWAGGFILGGAAVLGMAVMVLGGLWRRWQREQEDSARARLSLLTERGMLASVLAHEVRSPLTALRFNLHNLSTKLPGDLPELPRITRLLGGCEREIRRLDQMLQDFLVHTEVVGSRQAAKVNQVIIQAMEFLRPAMEARGIKLSMYLDGEDPRVEIHPDELRQVLLNLSANARDAMPQGGTLAISTILEDQTVLILFRDSGVGVSAEIQDRLFEPFFSTKPQGSGLGLALVRRVISGAGGSIFCESSPGSGTCFRLVIPRAAEEA